MARAKKEAVLTPEERLQAALVPDWEWPYKLPENWCWVKASGVARIYTGNSISEKIKADKYAGQQEGLLFIATKDIGFDNAINYETDIRIPDYPNFKIAPANTALLCIEGGSAGRKVGFVNREVCFGNKLCAFAAEKVNSKFIYYILQSQYFIQQFNNRKHGLIGGVSVNDLAEIGFPLSPLAEQQRIVDRIESLFAKLDEAREKAQAVVDSFETHKAAILHKAFTGELTAKWREEHGVGMESWEKHLLSTVSSLQTGLMKGKKYTGKTVELPYLRVANVQDGFLRLDEIKKIDVEENAISRYSLAVGDVLFTEGGDFDKLGRGTVWEGQIKNCLHQNHIFVVRPNPEVLNPYFLSYQAGSRYGKAYFLSCSKQTTNLASINSTQLKNFPVLIPSMMEQEVIIRLLDSSLEKEQQTKNIAESVLDQIDLMKKSILARAFRGELGTNDPSEESAVELLKRVL